MRKVQELGPVSGGGFDLAAALKGVPDLNTGEEQIVRLPLEAIDPDPENFYSLDGLDELAGNIETVGLLDPIRVRPNGERYTVVSGHRRRAACLLIRDGGNPMFDSGVPCIVEYGEASDAMRRLRLIYANSATRQLTAAEQSRQAEEVTQLLYELKAQGVEFPGRMRDHVAAACNLTKTKIGRLHAIRCNLHKDLLALFDRGDLVEDVAYQLSRFPAEIQEALADKLLDGRKHKMPIGSTVDAVWHNLAELQKPMSCRAHAGGPDCHAVTDKIVSSLCRPYSWNICDPGKCCLDCWHAKEGCSGACREARDRAKLDKAVEDEKKAERERDAEIAQRVLKNRIRERAKALLPYAEKAGLDDKARISGDYRSATVGQLRQWAEGDFGEAHFYGDECVRPGQAKDAVDMARKLGCSLEFALGLPEKIGETEQPSARQEGEEAGAAAWSAGKPKKAGWYATICTWPGDPSVRFHDVMVYRDDAWYDSEKSTRPVDDLILRWFRLPEEGT